MRGREVECLGLALVAGIAELSAGGGVTRRRGVSTQAYGPPFLDAAGGGRRGCRLPVAVRDHESRRGVLEVVAVKALLLNRLRLPATPDSGGNVPAVGPAEDRRSRWHEARTMLLREGSTSGPRRD